MARKDILEPNYKLQLDSHIHAVKIAYEDYKNATKRYLDASWIGSDGCPCYTSNYFDLLHDVELYTQKYREAVNRLAEFRKLHPEL